MRPRSRGATRPSFAIKFPYPPIRGRRECRAPDAPAVACASKSTRAAPRTWPRSIASYIASPGPGPCSRWSRWLRLLNCRQVKAGIEILLGRLRVGDAGVGHEEVADLLQPFHHGAVGIESLPLPG